MVKKNLLQIAVGILLSLPCVAQVDTSKTSRISVKPKPHNEVITSQAITDRGLFTVHQVGERWFFEIPDSLFKREFLTVSRIAKGGASLASKDRMVGYAGDEIGRGVFVFDKGPNSKIFIRTISFAKRAFDSSGNGLYYSLLNSSVQPILVSFDIKAFSPDSSGVVIDATDFINSDNIFFFRDINKQKLNLGTIQSDKSFIQKIQSFPLNIELRTTKSYLKKITASTPTATLEINTSVVLLPKEQMRPRYFDGRVGYFGVGFSDYDANPHGIQRTVMVTRWNLEPKTEDIERYKKGELVEPQKPIVFYIDPTTPKKWIPYLIQGVNDWQKAFEKAGFKNAIYAKEAPVNDSTWSLEDARHSVIVYKPSDAENASGPNVNDPRTGEIIESHINWYHNVMQLLHDWYFVQASPIDPQARKAKFSDSLMGQLIRFVVSHEVGHTLGLAHNFGSSSTIPVDSLRSKKWVEANGHTPSIMDYARFNYVAQPEDSISELGIFPRIGVYDEWAIEWGYRWFPGFESKENEKSFMNKWIIDRLGKDKRLWFGAQGSGDPRSQAEDLGNDAVKAGNYGINNLKRIMANVLEWTYQPNEYYDEASNMIKQVGSQYVRYLFHVTRNIGGITYNRKTVEQPGPVLGIRSQKEQKAAVEFLQNQLFSTPDWIVNKKVFPVAGGWTYYQITQVQQFVIKKILSFQTFLDMASFDHVQEGNSYTFLQLLSDLNSGIWSELKVKKPIDKYRRGLQKVYVTQLIDMFNQGAILKDEAGLTDFRSIFNFQIRQLINQINKVLPGFSDLQSRIHLEDLLDRLKKALESKQLEKPSTDKEDAKEDVPGAKSMYDLDKIWDGLSGKKYSDWEEQIEDEIYFEE